MFFKLYKTDPARNARPIDKVRKTRRGGALDANGMYWNDENLKTLVHTNMLLCFECSYVRPIEEFNRRHGQTCDGCREKMEQAKPRAKTLKGTEV